MRVLAAVARGIATLLGVALLVAVMPSRELASSEVELTAEVPAGATLALPVELARKWREAVLDANTLARLAAARATEDSEIARLEAAASVESAVNLVTLDGRVFHVVVEDSDGDRALTTSSELASLAAARAPDVVAKSCSGAGCTGTARVRGGAIPLDAPFGSARLMALGLGVLLALAVAVVPLAIATSVPARAPEPYPEPGDEAPHTERMPIPARTLGRTLPLGAANPPRGLQALVSADQSQARQVPQEASVKGQVEPSAATSPIMGYAASPGFQPNPALNAGARAALAAEIRGQAAEDCLVLAVSASAHRVDLKPASAVELALSVSSTGDRRVLLVEADFRNPGVAPLLGLSVPPAADFTREIGRRSEGLPSSALGVIICTPALHVLPALESASGDLVLTTHFEACLRTLRDFYDVIVVHAPPTAAGVYCTAVADVVDGVVVLGDAADTIPAAFTKKRFFRVIPA